MAEIIEESASFNYDIFQQIHCLSAASNLVGETRGTQAALQQAMQTALAEHVPHITGSWKVIWGPAVYKEQPDNEDTGPLNVWFAARDDQQKTVVVAVAGTAPTSPLAWLGDFDVAKIVAFDEWTATWTSSTIPDPPTTHTWTADDTRSLCSRGTCDFVRNILKFPSPASAVDPGRTLGDFLQKLQAGPDKYKIAFTGHSLGGAVAPAVAHGLVQAKWLTPESVSVLPSAGPSPGNAVFKSNFSNNFPPSGSGYKSYNSVLFNQLDIVPQAWSLNTTDDRNLYNIVGKIYTGLPWWLSALVDLLVGTAEALSFLGVPYRPLPGSAFSGRSIPTITGTASLGDSIAYEHSAAYWLYIGIEAFVASFARSVKAQPGVAPLPHAPDYREAFYHDNVSNSPEGNKDTDEPKLQQYLSDFKAYVSKVESEVGGRKS